MSYKYKHIINIGEGFYNVRGTYRYKGVIELGDLKCTKH